MQNRDSSEEEFPQGRGCHSWDLGWWTAGSHTHHREPQGILSCPVLSPPVAWQQQAACTTNPAPRGWARLGKSHPDPGRDGIRAKCETASCHKLGSSWTQESWQALEYLEVLVSGVKNNTKEKKPNWYLSWYQEILSQGSLNWSKLMSICLWNRTWNLLPCFLLSIALHRAHKPNQGFVWPPVPGFLPQSIDLQPS